MAAGLMRIFGKNTRTQLLVLGVILAVLGAVGGMGVMMWPNEDPASIIENPAKEEYYNAVSFWAILSLFVVAITGILLVGIATTGLPLVHAAKYHMGVFYVSVFSLILIPATIAMRMGGQLLANAMCDTMFVEGIVKQEFSSPAGTFGLLFGAIAMGLAMFVIFLNLMSMAKVAYRPSLVKGGALIGITMAGLIIVTMTVMPFLAAVQFDHELGRQSAVGFESFDPKDVMLTQAWIKYLSKAEYASTYGSMSFWLTMMIWFVFLALLVTIVGFIGLALYSANDRSPSVYSLSMAPIGGLVFSILAAMCYFGFSGTLGDMAERLNVSSEVTRFTYSAGNMWIGLLLLIVVLGLGAFYTMSVRDWIQALSKGNKVADPISMTSLVDPPTDLPPPPTGWPARWDRMSTANYLVIGVVIIVLLAGSGGGIYIKRGEDTSSSINTGQRDEVIDLSRLPDEEVAIPWADYAAEGGSPRPIIWQPTGTWFIKEMELMVQWTDEEPNFRHQNLPDVMEISINSSTGEGDSTTGASTTTTRQGEVRLRVEFDQYILTTDLTGVDLPDGAVEGAINATIACTEAGDQEPTGFGFLTFTDGGNDFTAILRIFYKNYDRS
jgi:hypothetical protein